MQDFKRMLVWQRAYALSITLRNAARSWGRAGYADLRSQLTRAAASIATNIAEGCGAATKKEFARYLDMAIKSANETEHHLLSTKDLDLISPRDWRQYSDETTEIRKMTYAYRKRLLDDDDNNDD